MCGCEVNIAHYNEKHVFIDLYNEMDYTILWTEQRMTIEGKLMRIQAWKPFVKHDEETSIVTVWILLPILPWYYYNKPFLTPWMGSVGKVLYLDTASIKRFRTRMGKVKIQIDLTNPRLRHISIGLDPKDDTIRFLQPVEYENFPPYCEYCKH